MGQMTAKSVEDVLWWIETTRHHAASAEDPKFFVLKGYGQTLRIPEAIHKQTFRLVEPSKDFFDQRMYRATKSGKARLRRAGRSIKEPNYA